jgi:hypothetical protein
MTQNAIAPLNPTTESGTALATRLTNAEQGWLTHHAGTSRPSYAVEGTVWINNTTNPRIIYLYDGAVDIPIFRYAASTSRLRSRAAESTVASASTTNIMGEATDDVAISGTATITSLGTEPNQRKFVRATGAFTLTHHATTLILPNNGSNITAASGDTFIASSDASGNVRVSAYQRAAGTALVAAAGDIPSTTKMVFFQAAAPSGWTIDGTHNDKLMRIVSSAGGGSGGSLNFSTVFGYTATSGYTLATADIPAHGHAATGLTGSVGTSITNGDQQNRNLSNSDFGDTGVDSGNQKNVFDAIGSSSEVTISLASGTVTMGGTTANAGGGGSHAHNIDMRARYIDVIIATKN